MVCPGPALAGLRLYELSRKKPALAWCPAPGRRDGRQIPACEPVHPPRGGVGIKGHPADRREQARPQLDPERSPRPAVPGSPARPASRPAGRAADVRITSGSTRPLSLRQASRFWPWPQMRRFWLAEAASAPNSSRWRQAVTPAVTTPPSRVSRSPELPGADTRNSLARKYSADSPNRTWAGAPTWAVLMRSRPTAPAREASSASSAPTAGASADAQRVVASAAGAHRPRVMAPPQASTSRSTRAAPGCPPGSGRCERMGGICSGPREVASRNSRLSGGAPADDAQRARPLRGPGPHPDGGADRVQRLGSRPAAACASCATSSRRNIWWPWRSSRRPGCGNWCRS